MLQSWVNLTIVNDVEFSVRYWHPEIRAILTEWFEWFLFGQVEGPFRIFLREKCIGYFILRAESKPPPPPLSREETDGMLNEELM